MKVNVTVTNSININETVTGFHCVASCSGGYVTLCLIFYFVEFTVIVVGIVAAVILYSRIIYTLCKRRHKMSRRFTVQIKDLKSENRIENESDLLTNGKKTRSTGISANTELNDKIEKNVSICTNASTKQHTCRTFIQKTSVSSDLCSVKMKPVEWNITLMMFATTVVFLVCFTPYFVIRILWKLVLKADEENNYNAFIQLSLKLPYFNSAANPIIYSIFNANFRRFIKTLVLNCCKCCRQ
jgi:hypothetical protein